MSDLREVLQENSYLRQKQLIFADCDRYQRARVSTLLSIAAAVAGADYDARRKNLKLTEKAQHLSQEIQAGITEFEAVLTAGFTADPSLPQGAAGGGRHHLGGRRQGRPHAAGV